MHGIGLKSNFQGLSLAVAAVPLAPSGLGFRVPALIGRQRPADIIHFGKTALFVASSEHFVPACID
jgi:hypothetical protein